MGPPARGRRRGHGAAERHPGWTGSACGTYTDEERNDGTVKGEADQGGARRERNEMNAELLGGKHGHARGPVPAR